MPEAVIVSVARTPIGRANKGSLKDFRPDDLTALITKTALDKIPALDPNTIDDFMLGVGLPGGEAGFNMARVAAVLLGYDHLPGTTLTRYCASSLQTTRMAMHAIKAGEGEVFISAGVETVSRHVKGSSDSLPDTMNPLFGDARARTATAARSRSAPATSWTACSRTPRRRWPWFRSTAEPAVGRTRVRGRIPRDPPPDSSCVVRFRTAAPAEACGPRRPS